MEKEGLELLRSQAFVSVQRQRKQLHREAVTADAAAVLLTGDHAQTANYFAQQVGISAVHSELLLNRKLRKYANCKTMAATSA